MRGRELRRTCARGKLYVTASGGLCLRPVTFIVASRKKYAVYKVCGRE